MALFSTFAAASAAVEGRKIVSYGTLILMPTDYATMVVDFGSAAWPPQHDKAKVCPRVLLVSTWTDNRWHIEYYNASLWSVELLFVVRS